VSDVLGIGPHPDDIELAAGGTVSLLAGRGYRVTLIDLTQGERSTRGSPEVRAREAADAAEILGAAREGLGLPDGGLSARDPHQLEAVVEVLRRHRPRLVLTLHWNDTHPDHVEGGELVRRAAYLSGLRNFPPAGSEPFRPPRVLYGMGRRAFVPTVVVDITAVHEAKRRSLHAYRSQFFRGRDDPLVTPISEPDFLDRIEARDRTYGGMIGAAFGEPFHEDGPSAVLDPRFLVGEKPR
jgi:bacillithiol biosynthesis deacetylase BshB1